MTRHAWHTVLLTVLPAFAFSEAGDRSPQARIAQKERLTLEVDNADLRVLVDLLRGGGVRATLVVDPDVRETVSIRLENVHWREALERIARKAHCVLVEERGHNVFRFVQPPSGGIEFRDADLRVALELLAKYAGIDWVVPDGVQGTVSFTLRRPTEESRQKLEELMEEHGLVSATVRLPALACSLAPEDPPVVKADPPWKLHGPLRASPDGHFLEHADGTPFFWLGDTAWALHQNLSRKDVLRYLDDAARAGFNVIQLMSVNPWAMDDWRNFYGDRPYREGTPSRLNPPFWRHLGWVIDQTASRGLFVLLVYGSPGRTDNHGAVARTPEEAYAYGNAVGTLYKDRPNLIWSGGIDVNPDDARRVSPMGMAGWHAMAEGVADGTNGVHKLDGEADWDSTLMTYHPRGGSTSSTWFHDAPWLDFHGAQIGWKGTTLLRTVEADYARKPPKPIVDIEPWYERCTWKTPPVDDWDVRLQAYQSVFAGACGHTYGHHHIWPLDSPGLDYGKQWREALKAPGRMQMRFLRRLMESQPQTGRAPLRELVLEPEGGDEKSLRIDRRIAATGGADGSWALVYSPRGASFSVDFRALKARRLTASWYDPRTGHLQPIGTLDATRRRPFDPPGSPASGNDWVLILR